MSAPPIKPTDLETPVAYDLWSQEYDAFDNPMLAMVDLAFERRPLRLEGSRVVELGCGTGRNVDRVFAAGAASYVGFDQSPGMLEKAKSKHPQANFAVADIEKRLPLEDGSVDFVLVTLVFEHLASLDMTMREISRILSQGGRVRILELHSDLRNRGTRAHFKVGESEIAIPSFAHDEREWRETIPSAQLSVLWIEECIADPEAIEKCAKLAKHEGRSVIFDIEALKR